MRFTRPTDQPDHRAKHGMYRSLCAGMVEGVTNGYKKELELVGVGFRAQASGQQLTLSLGFSHPIVIELPKEVKVTAESQKGSNPKVTLESHDKQLIGTVAAKIRSLRKPEPYKGKVSATWTSTSAARSASPRPSNRIRHVRSKQETQDPCASRRASVARSANGRARA